MCAWWLSILADLQRLHAGVPLVPSPPRHLAAPLPPLRPSTAGVQPCRRAPPAGPAAASQSARKRRRRMAAAAAAAQTLLLQLMLPGRALPHAGPLSAEQSAHLQGRKQAVWGSCKTEGQRACDMRKQVSDQTIHAMPPSQDTARHEVPLLGASPVGGGGSRPSGSNSILGGMTSGLLAAAAMVAPRRCV
jgi:hypothetical protein